MSQGGQANRRTPQYNDPYHALNSIGNLNAPTSGKAFGSGNSMSDPFANQPNPNQSPTIYTTQDNGYQNPILSGVNQIQPSNVYTGTTSIGTMTNQLNSYADTQANAMQYTTTQNSLFPMNQVDGEKNGLHLNPDLNSFDTSGQPVDQNYGNYNSYNQSRQNSAYGSPNNQGYYQPANNYQQQPDAMGNQVGSQPYPQTPNNYHIAQDYDQMYTHAPLLPEVNDARPNGNITKYKNQDQYFDVSTAEGSMDYLNSIAPPAPQKTGLGSLAAKAPSKLFPIIGGAMIALVILVAIVAALGSAQKDGPTEKIAAMNASFQSLQTIIDYGKSNNFSSDMTDVLAETNLVMSSDRKALDNAGLGASANSSGDSSSDNSDSSTSASGGISADEFKSQMDKAKSSGNLERTYEDALKNAYSDVANKAKDVYENIDDDNAKTALSNFYKNITALSTSADNAMASDYTSSGLIKYYTYIPGWTVDTSGLPIIVSQGINTDN